MKNIRSFLGKPIIAYTIEQAIKTRMFDAIFVLTDSEEIASVASSKGANILWLDRVHAQDIGLARLLIHVFKRDDLYPRMNPNYACCLMATCPFIKVEDIQMGFDVLSITGANSAFTVTTFPFPIRRALEIKDGLLEMIWPEHEFTLSQNLPEAYHDAAHFYWLNVRGFLKTNRIYGPRARPIPIPRERVQDIDTEEDWRRAELMYQILEKENKL
jgi:pseudaminic acid cytidylyltransferase